MAPGIKISYIGLLVDSSIRLYFTNKTILGIRPLLTDPRLHDPRLHAPRA